MDSIALEEKPDSAGSAGMPPLRYCVGGLRAPALLSLSKGRSFVILNQSEHQN
jgi:hypothetical protein